MSHAIDGYLAGYFLPTVRRVIDPLIAPHGFRWDGDRHRVSARWAAGPRFLEVAYLPETSPEYELLLAVGESDGTEETSLGVWQLLPAQDVERIAMWSFDGPQALERELLRAWREAIVPYALRAWAQEGRLARLAAEHEAELDEEEERIELARLLEQARAAFREGRFDDALQAYEQAGRDALRESDRRRVDIARARRGG